MKVYTKSGDRGTTSLIGGERVFKTDERVEAYGSVDELSAFIALLADKIRKEEGLRERVEELNWIQARLMTVEAVLAKGDGETAKVAPFGEEPVKWLEERIDKIDAQNKPIDKFTLPGGNEVVSLAHVCRTVCRRAERASLRADQQYGIEAEVLKFLNRLSDYFYVLGRLMTQYFEVEEILWIP